MFFALVLLAAAGLPWDLNELMRAPRWWPAPEFTEPGVRALFYEGLSWDDKPTRVFAWYGLPEKRAGKVPAMVLIHGGGGTAYAGWVRIWTKRGYAALAMDTGGSVPERGVSKDPWRLRTPRHQWGGPPGWGDFKNVDLPPGRQWPYHGVADVILAHSLLRSFPEIDRSRIGVTGISWGGYLTAIAASLDTRFRFAAPVYGCGFLGEDSAWLPIFEKMGREKARRWLDLWDPSRYLPRCRVPMLWLSGTNDTHYPLGSLQKSYLLPRAPRTVVIRVGMKHSHEDGAEVPEIFGMASTLLKGGVPLARITGQGLKGRELWVRFDAKAPVTKAELNYTRDNGPWKQRKWMTAAGRVDARKRHASASIPEGTTACYLNLIDARGLMVSSNRIEQPAP